MDDETIRFISLASQCKGNTELEHSLAQIIAGNFQLYLKEKELKEFKKTTKQHPYLITEYNSVTVTKPTSDLFDKLNWTMLNCGVWTVSIANKPDTHLTLLVYKHILKYLLANNHTISNPLKINHTSFYLEKNRIMMSR